MKNHVKFHSANGKRQILIADDDKNIRRLLSAVLQNAGYTAVFRAKSSFTERPEQPWIEEGGDELRVGVAFKGLVEVDEACHMTMSMSPIFPKDTDPKVVAKLMAIPGMIRNKEPAATDGKPAKKPRRKKPRKGR